jgi:O6-methylguanine-DNA--protein-cysteine methyltransferase
MYTVQQDRGTAKLYGKDALETGMRVEWTSYSSPIGALTVVECEAGPLVIEFPSRAVTIKWAVRLRAAVPELHIAQGSCRITSAWLDDYFSGSPRPFAYPDYLRRWFDLSPAQITVFKTLRKIPLGETRSYDDIARATRLHPRQIGWLVAAIHRQPDQHEAQLDGDGIEVATRLFGCLTHITSPCLRYTSLACSAAGSSKAGGRRPKSTR